MSRLKASRTIECHCEAEFRYTKDSNIFEETPDLRKLKNPNSGDSVCKIDQFAISGKWEATPMRQCPGLKKIVKGQSWRRINCNMGEARETSLSDSDNT